MKRLLTIGFALVMSSCMTAQFDEYEKDAGIHFKKNSGLFMSCLTAAKARNPNTAGIAHLSFKIGHMGGVLDPEVTTNGVTDPKLNSCLITQATTLQFPVPPNFREDAMVTFKVPFYLTPPATTL